MKAVIAKSAAITKVALKVSFSNPRRVKRPPVALSLPKDAPRLASER